MVIGKIGTIYVDAVFKEQAKVRMEWFSKLSRKDFIKKFTSKGFFDNSKAADEEWWVGSGKFGNEK